MKEKKLKLITEVIAIVVICLISFVGIYNLNANKMENKVKGYDLTKDFTGYREFVFEVSEEGENLNEENYNKSKKIIQERLKNLNVEDYNISLNKENGAIYLQVPENSETDHIASNILQVADFKITDSEDESKVFLTNNNLKKVSAIYNTTTSGTTVYLQIKFNKNGKNVLKDISSGEYKTKQEEDSEETTSDVTANATVTTEETTVDTETQEENADTENSATESEEKQENTQKKIKLSIDNNNMITTSFDDPIEDGTLYLSMGQASTDSETISNSLKSTSTIGVVLNSGKMPITYKISEDRYINVNNNTNTIKYLIYAIIVLAIIALLFVVIKYKFKGIIAIISYAGFIAVFLLAVRYTNVAVSYESIVAMAIVFAINYITVCKLLNIKETDKELKKLAYKNAIKSTIARLIPIFIISVIFAFIKWASLATFGMSMFWGIVISIIYNYILTKDMLD